MQWGSSAGLVLGQMEPEVQVAMLGLVLRRMQTSLPFNGLVLVTLHLFKTQKPFMIRFPGFANLGFEALDLRLQIQGVYHLMA